ncbi:MAG: hypothetical protein HQL47_09375 [Gammaproteobacteria bacterium]|nr:hypothetical protein [Gammaproteobacteria bacterium]
MAFNPRHLWLVLGLLLASLAGTALFKAWPVIFPQLEQRMELDPSCNLRAGPCVSSLPDGGKLSFSISPRDIPTLSPLQLEVQISNSQAYSVEVDFSGVDMYMGYNRVRLQEQAAGSYQAEARLPVCVRDAMEWEAQVLLRGKRGYVSVPFRFITLKAGAL